MNPNYDDIANTSRDLGAWAADASDIAGVDEVSLAMRAAAALSDALLAGYTHHSATFVTGDETVFQSDATPPQVIGGMHASAGNADVFQTKNAFEDDQAVPPPTIGG